MCGSVAEWSKALVLGTSLFGGVGSNPTAAISFVVIQENWNNMNIWFYLAQTGWQGGRGSVV